DALRAGGDRLAVHPIRAHHILSLPAYPCPHGEGRQRSGALQFRQRAEQAEDQPEAARHDLIAGGFSDNRLAADAHAVYSLLSAVHIPAADEPRVLRWRRVAARQRAQAARRWVHLCEPIDRDSLRHVDVPTLAAVRQE
ncbi:hypothetical protein AAVH_36356, partial [Aphelenchoides avenae]